MSKPQIPLAADTPEPLIEEEAPAVVEAEPEPTELDLADSVPAEEPQTPAPYTSQDQVGSVTADQLLARLDQLRDPEAQAEENPELWKIRQAICRQMVKCWRVDTRNPPSHKFSVDIKVAFDPQGSLQKAQIGEVGRMESILLSLLRTSPDQALKEEK